MTKQLKLNDLYNSLPNSWDTLKYKHYKQIINLKLEDESDIDVNDAMVVNDPNVILANVKANVENTASILSVLLDVPVDSILNLEQKHYLLLVDRIKFIYTEPDVKGYKSNIKWKDMMTLTVNDYILYFTLAQNPTDNLGAIVKAFTVNEYSDEQIEDMSALEVLYAFFLLLKQLTRYTKRQTLREQMRALRFSSKQILMKIQFWRRKGK